MTRYAEGTAVNVERSRAEIEKTLQRFGAERFMSGWDQQRAYIAFIYAGRAIRMTLELPSKEKFRHTPTRREWRSDEDTFKHWEQGCRERWRALALMVKAKLVGVTEGITTFEQEFLAYTMLPQGQTVSDWLEPQIAIMLESGQMPKMLMPGTDVRQELGQVI